MNNVEQTLYSYLDDNGYDNIDSVEEKKDTFSAIITYKNGNSEEWEIIPDTEESAIRESLSYYKQKSLKELLEISKYYPGIRDYFDPFKYVNSTTMDTYYTKYNGYYINLLNND